MAGTFPRKRWVTPAVDEAGVAALARDLDLPLPIAAVLSARGHANGPVEPFLNPRLSDLADPDSLPNMPLAVERLWGALDRREPILVFGDYDVDGVCSCALLVRVFRALGGQVEPFIPNRMAHGYGLSVGALQECLDRRKPALIVTVDCGTGSVEAVRLARAHGVDVIVTDHHEPDGETAEALALVNPKLQPGHPAGLLAGVGVAFKLCHALVKRGLALQKPAARTIDLRTHLDLVAVATVADVVPLLGENRILVSHGLRRLNTAPCVGLRALIEAAAIKPRPLDCHHIGFMLGPRLNAAGRLGGAEAALGLLLTDDPAVAAQRAQELEAANRERKDIENTILTEAREDIEAASVHGTPYGIVVGRPGWHIGTVGIVASRLVARFGRPAVVLGLDQEGRGRGSCRSIEALDVLDALRECEDVLVRFGGHKMAAGVEIEAAHLAELQDRFNQACRRLLDGKDLRPVQTVDAWIGLGDADARLIAALNRLRPLGTGNPEPTWGVRNVCLASPPRRVGKDARHLKLQVAKGGSQVAAVGFNLGEFEVPDGELDIVFQIRENWFNGRGAVELEVADMRPAAKSVADGPG